MPLHVAARGHGDGHRAQQHGDEARERQEPPRTVCGGLDLRARFFDIEQALAALPCVVEPALEVGDGLGFAREQHRLARARAGLQELGGLEVVAVDEHGGRELREAAALVGARDEHAADAQRHLAHLHGVAHLAAERREELGVRPGLAARRARGHGGRRTEGDVGDAHRAAQRVAVADEAHVGELRRLAELRHAERRGAARDREAAAARLLLVLVADRARRLEPQVGGEHLVRLQRDGLFDAVDQEADAGERGDRDRQREQQDAELARLPFAGELPQPERDGVDGGHVSPGRAAPPP